MRSLSRHIPKRITEVKCNFCFQWMKLMTQIKYNINICDPCLYQIYGSNNLHAVSSKGQIFQLYIIKQNSIIGLNQNIKCQNLDQMDFDQQQTQFDSNNQIKVQLIEEIDQYRNNQLKVVLNKWQNITNLIKNKQEVSLEQIQKLKKNCQEKINQLKYKNSQFQNDLQNFAFQENNSLQDIKINIFEPFAKNNQKYNNQNIKNQKYQISLNNNQINLNNGMKQNKIKTVQQLKLKNSFNQKRKRAGGLRQIDQNSLSLTPRQIRANQNYSQISKTSFFDEQSAPDSFKLNKSQLYLPLRSFGSMKQRSTNYSSKDMQKDKENQGIDKYKIAKQKAIKYLQKNYDSSSLTRLMLSNVLETFMNTSKLLKNMELISYNLSTTDLKCFLQALDWTTIQTIKLVKTKLSDQQFKILIDFIIQKELKIRILVLTSNKLTQKSIQYLGRKYQQLSYLQQIYLGRNRIRKIKVRPIISQLTQVYSLYL